MANILVIDDDTSLLQMISIMLKRAGHSTILADNGQEGVNIASHQIPDMVIVDVMMPGMSGYDVCKALRKDLATKKIPLLMLTALSQNEHRGRAEDAGADGFVTKPVTRDDLVKHVEELLRTGARNFPEFTGQLPSSKVEEPPPAPPAPEPAPAAPPAPAPAAPPVPAAAVNQMGAVGEIFKSDAPAAPPSGSASSIRTTATYPAIVTRLPLVAVIGLSKGVGVTTLAVNLSLALMQFGRTCIVDLNNQSGQVGPHLKITPRGTWLNLLQFSPGADKRLVAQALTMDHPSGVAVVAAPTSPVTERLRGSSLFYTYTVLAEGFSRVVVDLPNELDATSIATLNTADHVVLVLGNDPAAIGSVPDALGAIEAMRIPGQLHVVLNHVRPQGIPYEQAMQAINQPLASDIPYESAQGNALTTGQPLIMSQPGSLFSRTVLHLARQM